MLESAQVTQRPVLQTWHIQVNCVSGLLFLKLDYHSKTKTSNTKSTIADDHYSRFQYL